VSDEAYEAALVMAERDQTEEQARIEHLQDSLRENLAMPMAELYGKHPDDFKSG